jgi:hypothetical protein
MAIDVFVELVGLRPQRILVKVMEEWQFHEDRHPERAAQVRRAGAIDIARDIAISSEQARPDEFAAVRLVLTAIACAGC